LANQIKALEKDFLENDGLRERMTKVRIESRNKKN
jgi:four helix bundle suffix protein